MADKSAIQWTDATWNPITGCTRVSPGCANCYIERTPPFRIQGRRFEQIGQTSTTGVLLHPERLDQPIRWKRPRRIFVCSLADLFHEDVPDSYIAQIFDTMRQAPQHIFQILTKRPARALDLIPELYFYGGEYEINDYADDGKALPNVWVGVSIENARYTDRAEVLREIPAAVRFVSAEPLLGSLYPTAGSYPCPTGFACTGCRYCETEREKLDKNASIPTPKADHPVGVAGDAPEGGTDTRGRAALDLTDIDWCIIGGESGPGARPFHLEHAREIIAACREHDVAPFVKQLGAKPVDHIDGAPSGWPSYDSPLRLRDSKGGDMDEWPADVRIREFPAAIATPA